MSKHGGEIERLADFVTLMKRRPHTIAEVAVILGVGRTAVRTWVHTFQDKGHVREYAPIKSGNTWASTWGWV